MNAVALPDPFPNIPVLATAPSCLLPPLHYPDPSSLCARQRYISPRCSTLRIVPEPLHPAHTLQPNSTLIGGHVLRRSESCARLCVARPERASCKLLMDAIGIRPGSGIWWRTWLQWRVRWPSGVRWRRTRSWGLRACPGWPSSRCGPPVSAQTPSPWVISGAYTHVWHSA